jgi:tetratricopeptide (TPR) repeat protein
MLVATCVVAVFTFSATAAAATNPKQPPFVAARDARDRASVDELQRIIAQQTDAAKRDNSFDAHLRLAVLQSWLCEAAGVHKNGKLIKQAASDGLAAAEKAVALNPQSSEAHHLVGELLSQMIPHVFGGGMRYGKRSADAMDKAIALNPKNAGAYISRAVSYYYTPPAFGGGKEKAFDFLRKAVDLDPKDDTPHVWLAMFFLETQQVKEASREILVARAINPKRAFTNSVFEQINTATQQKP